MVGIQIEFDQAPKLLFKQLNMSALNQLQTKRTQMQNLITRMRADNSMKSFKTRTGRDVALVNHFQQLEDIPNKWFDWVERVDAEIMIIGQDWGPFVALEKSVLKFDGYLQGVGGSHQDAGHRREFMFAEASSRTEKFIIKSVEESYREKFGREHDLELWDNIIFTMSVLFTRQGKHFRGSANFDPKLSFEHSYQYVSEQISIVKPKKIIALGGMAFEVLNRFFSLGYGNANITQIVEMNRSSSGITAQGGDFECTIIPNFHPAAHVSKEVMREQWGKIWG